MSSTRKRIGKATGKSGKQSKILIPKKYISFAVVLFCLFIIGGGIYNILDNPPPGLSLPGGYTSLHPYTSEQTSTEGYVVMLINGFAIAGFYLTYRSSQITYNRVSANRYLMAGIALILIGFGGNYLLLRIKMSLL
jgi:hypothetical protein